MRLVSGHSSVGSRLVIVLGQDWTRLIQTLLAELELED